jgi:hypothetical protein
MIEDFTCGHDDECECPPFTTNKYLDLSNLEVAISNFKQLTKELWRIDHIDLNPRNKLIAKSAFREDFYRKFLPSYKAPLYDDIEMPGLTKLYAKFIPSSKKTTLRNLKRGKADGVKIFLDQDDQPFLRKASGWAKPGQHFVAIVCRFDQDVLNPLVSILVFNVNL